MEPELAHLLDEIYRSGQVHDAEQTEHGRKMLNLEPDSARFISILVRSSRRTRLLEIGTSNGYSTIWLAWSAQSADGRIWSIDRNARETPPGTREFAARQPHRPGTAPDR